MRSIKSYFWLSYSFLLISPVAHSENLASSDKAILGQTLFFDVNLSKNRTQSCASCHNPNHAFIDDRKSELNGMVSKGDDEQSFGDRNTPTISYASSIPRITINNKGEFKGGLFLDGRERDLSGQAGGPPVNPVEMGMPNKEAVIERLKENSYYVSSFKALFGEDIFSQPDSAYKAMTDSIAEFERTEFFSPYDSKYDRYLRGEVKLSKQESLGEALFFSQQFTNCNRCHQLKTFPNSQNETFSNYQYHNLGVPLNKIVREYNGLGEEHIDRGLLEHPRIHDEKQMGKFKVPTLRNVAVTGPYMHNGIFKDLRTVVLFYDKFNNPTRTLNPETGKPWREPEVAVNLALETDEFKAPALSDKEVDALVAFMKALTDQRYEHLIEP
ncbi:c-type cytochrome [Vibrio sp.]|uniref:Methylamine utilization protein MauG n=1 Tax=Vibrio viridaestus TaxID=2487322 RepID=A0A3N9TKM5_9VIBR|nr:cytochrome c peroxidase [Vibrio viridaestus]MDC0611764.1 c-type cytochrome [Vibrio sp.]RQW64544.1 methylamine utilization protein MauG [Vibrio viridaestus]